MKYSWIIISILFAGALIGAGFYFSEPAGEARVDNVSIIDGKQVIEIKAKGGYQPRVSFAKAGIPTIIRFDTEGTFDCSSSVRIAGMDILRLLQRSGTTDIDIGVQEANTLQGSCGMGMYPFEIEFQS